MCARATRSSSPSSSTTPISCRGRCSAPRRARGCASRRSTTAAQIILDEYEKLLGPEDAHRLAHAGLERARHGDAGAGDDRDRASPRRLRARRRRAGGLAHAGRRAGARLRLLRLLRPQGVRPDRHRRPLRQARRARAHAALAGRRQHDRRRHLREDDLPGRRRSASRPAPAISPTRSGSAPRSTISIASAWR